MMKRKLFKIKIIFLKLLNDIFYLYISFLLAYVLKFKLKDLFELFNLNYGRVYTHAQIEPYIQLGFIAIPFWVITFYFVGLYESRKGVLAEVDELVKVFKAVVIALLEVTVITYLFPRFPSARYVLLYFGIISFILISISRMFIHKIEVIERSKGKGNLRTLIVGAEDLGQTIGTRMISVPNYGYTLIGFLDDLEPKEVQFNLQKSYKYFGEIKNLKNIVQENKIEAIFITKSDYPRDELTELSVFCENRNIKLYYVSDYFTILSDNINVEDFDGLPLMSLKDNKFTPWNNFLKRDMDIILSLLIIMNSVPVFLMIYILLKIEKFKAPVLYKQKRVGKDGKVFDIYKFRTMEHGEDPAGPSQTHYHKDERITRVGKILRKTSMDELPQLFNILKGEMSIVGPRPEQPYFVEQYEARIPTFSERHRVRGGLTGWAQINGRSALTSRPEEKLKYDLYYIENWSLILDIKIIIKTIFQVITLKQVV